MSGEVVEPMSRHEREELARLTKARARVAKARVEDRAAELLADTEAELAAIYRIDDDAWADVTAEVTRLVNETDKVIAAKCRELGIRDEFRPSINVGWWGRGENAASKRRAELRKVAQTRIAALARRAKADIDAASLDVQTRLMVGGFESAEARAFVEARPTVEQLMPPST